MATYSKALALLDRALNAQGHRKVALEAFHSPVIKLPASVGGQVDAALQAIGRDPNWQEVSRQLNQLHTKNFVSVYVRRDKHDLELVAIHGFAGPLSLKGAMGYVDWLWTITKGLGNELGKFKLSETNLAVLVKAAQQVAAAYEGRTTQVKAGKTLGSAPPSGFAWADRATQALGQADDPYRIPAGEDVGPIGSQQPAGGAAETSPAVASSQGAGPASVVLSVIQTLLDLDMATAPNMTFLAVSTNGFAADTLREATDITFGGLQRRQTFSLSSGVLSTVLVDSRNLTSMGQSASRGVNVKDLQKNLQFLDHSGR